jgi:HAE1 family hydrophobic/amphiphilic exporter-1
MVNFFIERPIFAASVAIIMVLAGLICYPLLPVAQFPEVTPPLVVVSATYPGASAQVVADTVTTPLEQQINGVPGMIYMSSTSANDGSSNITVSFDVGYPIDIAAVDVQNRVSAATAQLPAIVNQGGVTVQKKNPNLTLAVNLYSPDGSVDLVTLSNYAYLQLVDPLKRITGVGDVQIFGERRYSMRVWLDPDKLAKLGVTAVDVQNAIAEQNIQVAAGKIGGSPAPAGTMFTAQVNAMGRLSDPQQFDDIVIRAGTGSEATLRLRDVGRTELGALQYTSSAKINDKPTVFVAVLPLPGSNALAMDQADGRARQEFPERDQLRHRLRHDHVRVGVDARRAGHAGRGPVARHRRRLPVSPELAHHGHPRDRHSRFPHRDACRDDGARLLAQHREHAGTGLGDWPRGR